MPEKKYEVKVDSGVYMRAMDTFLPATLVEFDEGHMRVHVPQSVIERLVERGIPHTIVE
ncbi:MAG: hypothetical protein AAB343_03010 [Patescibacteria group bacterium]